MGVVLVVILDRVCRARLPNSRVVCPPFSEPWGSSEGPLPFFLQNARIPLRIAVFSQPLVRDIMPIAH